MWAGGRFSPAGVRTGFCSGIYSVVAATGTPGKESERCVLLWAKAALRLSASTLLLAGCPGQRAANTTVRGEPGVLNLSLGL